MASLDQIAAAAISATEPAVVPFAGKTVRVLPPMQWRQTAMKAVQANDFTTWAEKCLVNDLVVAEDGSVTGSDDKQVWADEDPTNQQVVDFLTAYAEAVGVTPGK